MLKSRLIAAVLATIVVASIPVAAQFGPGAGGRAPFANQPPARNEAGRFDYYSMVLSWSPTYCAGLQRNGYDPQCHRRDGRRYSFILHGLWPQHEKGWPENCATRDRPFVPQNIIDGMQDIMPSPKLVIHEYRKHGTCSGLTPEGYYDLSRKLFAKVKVPPRYERLNQALFVSPEEVTRDFLSVNPTLKPDMLAISCGGPGARLKEIRVCFSREGEFRSCGRNEDARRLCSAAKVYLPPVREEGPASGQATTPRRGTGTPSIPVPQQGPLPGPGDPGNARGERRI